MEKNHYLLRYFVRNEDRDFVAFSINKTKLAMHAKAFFAITIITLSTSSWNDMPILASRTAVKSASLRPTKAAKQSDLPKYAAAYRIESLAPNLHLYQISITVQNTEQKPELDFILPAWRPGRYQIQNYAANVQEFSARAGKVPLFSTKIDKQTWRVRTDNHSEVTVSYKYYAGAQLDAGNSYVGREEMYFNGSNLFMYTPETRFKPVSLYIDYPEGWSVATQLQRTDNPRLFTAETYDDLIDSPTIASPTLVTFSTKVKGVTLHICFHNGDALSGSRFNPAQISKDLAKIVETQFEMMKDVPLKEYWFLYHIMPYPFGHGVEHKNSTSIVLGPIDAVNTAEFYDRFLSITSHEFYHVWNIKRIIPKEFVPYDYTREVYTPMLYVSEGFTSYYGDLTLARSKLWSAKRYLSDLAANITSMQNQYGRKVQPLALSSFDAWLSGYGTGRANSTVNFYSKGELVGLILDMEIRKRTANKASLDDVMRLLNTEFAQKQRGFSAKDFESLVERVGQSSFAEFFEKYVYGTDELPFEQALAVAGLEVRKLPAPQPYFGASVKTERDFQVIESVVPESPAALAGFDKGDMLVAINNESLMGKTLTAALAKLKADTTVKIAFFRDGKLMEKSVKLAEAYTYDIVKRANPTALQRAVAESWLGTLWNEI
ncbi:MAG: PDZ domain-containing protein [Chloroherpetonaceae bacterium]|nr:PDZ domain-containing protein [Chloroherpetonaceae bacterium]MDW8018491.1 PDZ domain-containing protein [Chloroherpetonaceae bacterium]